MRRYARLQNVLLFAATVFVCGVTAVPRPAATRDHVKARLLRVSVYSSGLASGGACVDVRRGILECYSRDAGDAAPRVEFVPIRRQDLIDLEKLIRESGLHSLAPAKAGAASSPSDECTLLIVWDDGSRTFVIPPRTDSRRANKYVTEICDRVRRLERVCGAYYRVTGRTPDL